MTSHIPWNILRNAAVNALTRSYSPYSNYAVGCAGLTEEGNVVSGANVENASYGLTMCAENCMIADLFSKGGGKLVAFICVNADEDIIMPCGRCRQLLKEHASPEFIIETPKGIKTMEEILPQAFTREELGK